MKADVHCSDGLAGRSTGVIGNPMNRQITHLLVKSYRPPFHEYLVPVNEIKETPDGCIKLKCTRDQLIAMEPFEYEEYVPTEFSDYLDWPSELYDVAIPWNHMKEDLPYYDVKRQNIPADEVALRRDARVEATDGYVGQVDELLIDSKDMRVTHLVLLVRQIFEGREITIPVEQIDHIDQGTIYLKLDRQSVRELPTTPIQRWSR
jgi:sporulation protein YlmC with PRC-barrel domain